MIRLCLYETRTGYPTRVEDITHAQAVALIAKSSTIQKGYQDDEYCISWMAVKYEYVRGIRPDGVPFEIRWKAELSDFQTGDSSRERVTTSGENCDAQP